MGGSNILSKMLVIAFLLMGVGIVAVTAMMSRPPAGNEVRIHIAQLDGAQVRVAWHLLRPVDALAFEALDGDYRRRQWRMETPEYHVTYVDGAARLGRRDGRAFRDASITMAADAIRLPKEYQSLAPYGDGGVLLYTGHFHPLREDGSRFIAKFNLTAREGDRVVALDDQAAALADWQSPLRHPAFIYFGPQAPVETDHVIALVDPAAPQWIADEFDRLTPRAFNYFAAAFGPPTVFLTGGSPAPKPNLFLTAPLGDDEGRLSYAGDALPGQFQITLEGAGWRSLSSRGEDIFRRSTLHEAFHLWQSASAAPDAEMRAAWIHEGGADAVAVEAMVALGFWDGEDLAAFGDAARRDCVAGLRGGSLAGAHERQDFAALYACGYLVADAVARAEGATVTAFWRDFIGAARQAGGYSDGFFFDFVEARTGDQDFARALRYFVKTPLADPAREMDRLLAAAPAPAASSSLAPGEGR